MRAGRRKLDPTDIKGLQKLMNAKRELQDLQKLHISIQLKDKI